ncbi:uncharacterized protein LOC126888482 [Diabrotica virgifera virgifera]|uniref:Uncharacterized protein n=1 Tax=Diabrotica virgifera virgifera TaxID=50390 RepID=A0ABM5KRF3_DIAVI|nr:uncharacterized protein LOC126888482 [Diabrotica virgifera virgifera]
MMFKFVFSISEVAVSMPQPTRDPLVDFFRGGLFRKPFSLPNTEIQSSVFEGAFSFPLPVRDPLLDLCLGMLFRNPSFADIQAQIFSLMVTSSLAFIPEIIGFGLGVHALHKVAEKLGVPDTVFKVEHNVPDQVFAEPDGRQYVLKKQWIGSTPVLAKVYSDNGQVAFVDSSSSVGTPVNNNAVNQGESGSGNAAIEYSNEEEWNNRHN